VLAVILLLVVVIDRQPQWLKDANVRKRDIDDKYVEKKPNIRIRATQNTKR
jgi:hypothetical protein